MARTPSPEVAADSACNESETGDLDEQAPGEQGTMCFKRLLTALPQKAAQPLPAQETRRIHTDLMEFILLLIAAHHMRIDHDFAVLCRLTRTCRYLRFVLPVHVATGPYTTGTYIPRSIFSEACGVVHTVRLITAEACHRTHLSCAHHWRALQRALEVHSRFTPSLHIPQLATLRLDDAMTYSGFKYIKFVRVFQAQVRQQISVLRHHAYMHAQPHIIAALGAGSTHAGSRSVLKNYAQGNRDQIEHLYGVHSLGAMLRKSDNIYINRVLVKMYLSNLVDWQNTLLSTPDDLFFTRASITVHMFSGSQCQWLSGLPFLSLAHTQSTEQGDTWRNELIVYALEILYTMDSLCTGMVRSYSRDWAVLWLVKTALRNVGSYNEMYSAYKGCL